jgi:hypothetical protein
MSKLNFVTPTLVLIILALLFYLFNLRSQSKIDRLEREAESREHLEKVKALQIEAAVSRAKSAALEEARKKYTDSARTQQRARMQEIQAFKVTIANLKVKVQPQIDSNPNLSRLISTQDLVIRKQDNVIDSLQLAHSAEIINLTEQLKEKGTEIMKEAQKTEEWRTAAVESEKKNRKLTRGKGFRNVVIGVLTAGIVYVSLRSD